MTIPLFHRTVYMPLTLSVKLIGCHSHYYLCLYRPSRSVTATLSTRCPSPNSTKTRPVWFNIHHRWRLQRTCCRAPKT